MHIVLLEPEIPQNTGNIARTCKATNTKLDLIKPLGFSLEDKYLKRAGMDYFKTLTYNVHDSFEDFLNFYENPNIYFATTKSKKLYTDIKYKENDFILFGKEGRGIEEDILLRYKENCVRIPMFDDSRSLNLANSVAIVLYEALRQGDFKGLLLEGKLHRNTWEQ